jgi:hypothetical protein
MKNVVLILFLFVSSLIFAQEQTVEVPKIAVKIAIGEMVQFEKASVKFIQVLDDSRCPTDVTCVWAGQAKVQIEFQAVGGEKVEKEIIFGGKNETTLISTEEYILKAETLSPYPTSATVGKMNYILLVSEEIKEN